MTPEDDPFASFAAPREQPSPIEVWKRRRREEARQWRRLRAVGLWLMAGTLLGSVGAGMATGSLVTGGWLLAGSAVAMPLGLAMGWLVGFGSWGGRLLRSTRLVPTSEVPVPMTWLVVCSGIGLVAGAGGGSWALPYIMLGPGAADQVAVLGPMGVGVGAAAALVVVWMRRRKDGTPDV